MRSARSTRSRAGASRDEDAGLDLVGGGQQRPHLRVVAHDPPVLARVAGGRHPAGELVDRLRPADLLELAAAGAAISATVRWSILRSLSCSSSIASNTAPCCSR